MKISIQIMVSFQITIYGRRFHLDDGLIRYSRCLATSPLTASCFGKSSFARGQYGNQKVLVYYSNYGHNYMENMAHIDVMVEDPYGRYVCVYRAALP